MRFPDYEWIIFDLEFTDPNMCNALKIPKEIIEIGAVRMDGATGVVKAEFESFVRPINFVALTDHTLQLTGIDREQVEEAPTFDKVWRKFFEFTGDKRRLVSWTGIDHEVLRWAYALAGVDFPHNRNMGDAMSFVMGLSCLQGWHPQSYSLGGVARYFGMQQPPHRALNDAKLVADIIRELTN